MIDGKLYNFADYLHSYLDEPTFKLHTSFCGGDARHDARHASTIKLFHDEFGADATYTVEGCY